MNWNQTHALVTGGTRGIGRALVGLLLEKGGDRDCYGSYLRQRLSSPHGMSTGKLDRI